MTISVKHQKNTGLLSDWTQTVLDSVIAGNPPPLPPSGTLIDNIVLPSDFAADHVIDTAGASEGDVLTVVSGEAEWAAPSGGTPAGSDGQFQYNNGGAFGGVSTTFFNDATNRIGINTTSPEGVVHIKEFTYTAPPEPTGTVALNETDIDGGDFANDGNFFEIRVYTYKVVEGVTLYSSTYISQTYSDDGADDHTYNLIVVMEDELPAGADGYRAFIQWTNPTPEIVWNFNQYEQSSTTDILINSSPTAGTPTSGTVVYKTIHENLERWYKASTVRFMDSSGNTKAIWDKTNERFGVGTDSPTQFTHFKSTATTLPPNPTGTVTPTQVDEEEAPYIADGTTHAYRVYTYKIVGGQIILSNTFISGSFQDDESENLYYVNIAMSAAVPSGADGYFVIKESLNYSTVNYWIGGQNIEDRANYTSDNRAQFSTAIGRTLIDTANFEIVQSGTRRLFFDTADGSFDTLKVKTRNINQYGLRIECINGQNVNPISVVSSTGSNLFSVTNGGSLSFSGSISATSATLSAGLSGTTAAFSSNVTVGGTLAVTSAVTLTSTITARSATFSTTNTSSVGLTVNGTSGGTGALQQWRATVGGTIVASISAAGVYDTTQLVQSAAGFRLTAFGAYVGVQSAARCTFGNASGVSTFGTGTTSHVVSLIEAPTGQTADIQQWRVNSVAVASIAKNGAFKPASLADSAAENNTIYYSTDASKLVYKDAGAVVNPLYYTVKSATATLDFGSIGSNDSAELTITVTGAAVNDSVMLGAPAALEAGLTFAGFVSAADTVTIRVHNTSGGSVDPASATWRATVFKV